MPIPMRAETSFNFFKKLKKIILYKEFTPIINYICSLNEIPLATTTLSVARKTTFWFLDIFRGKVIILQTV